MCKENEIYRHEAVEVCPHCEAEVYVPDWAPVDGYRTQCTCCGESILLCDECLHAEDNPNRFCDWDKETLKCFRDREASDTKVRKKLKLSKIDRTVLQKLESEYLRMRFAIESVKNAFDTSMVQMAAFIKPARFSDTADERWSGDAMTQQQYGVADAIFADAVCLYISREFSVDVDGCKVVEHLRENRISYKNPLTADDVVQQIVDLLADNVVEEDDDVEDVDCSYPTVSRPVTGPRSLQFENGLYASLYYIVIPDACECHEWRSWKLRADKTYLPVVFTLFDTGKTDMKHSQFADMTTQIFAYRKIYISDSKIKAITGQKNGSLRISFVSLKEKERFVASYKTMVQKAVRDTKN